MNTNTVTDTLNELIETSRDGEQGFLRSAEDARDAGLKSFLHEGSEHCGQAARELQQQVAMLGGEPRDSGSLLAVAHRSWVDLKATVTGRDDVAILDECERGEDYARQRYEQALQADLPASMRLIVERQYQGVLANLRRVREWRDRLRAGETGAGPGHSDSYGSSSGINPTGLPGNVPGSTPNMPPPMM